MDLIKTCQSLVSIDSSPSHGTRGIVQTLSSLAQDLGLQASIIETSVKEYCNILIGPKGRLSEESVLFCSYLDTPLPGTYSLWDETSYNPFNCMVRNGRIYGLGASRGKLDFACKLKAASYFVKEKLSRPFLLVGTFGEEMGLIGPKLLLNSGRLNGRRAFIGACSHLKLVQKTHSVSLFEIHIPFSHEEIFIKRRSDKEESAVTQSRIFKSDSGYAFSGKKLESAALKLVKYLSQLPSDRMVLSAFGGTSMVSCPSEAVLELDLQASVKEGIGQKLIHVFEQLSDIEKDLKDIKDDSFIVPHAILNVGTLQTNTYGITVGVCLTFPPENSKQREESIIRKLKYKMAAIGATVICKEKRAAYLCKKDSEFHTTVEENLKTFYSGDTQCNLIAHRGSIFNEHMIDCVFIGPGDGDGHFHSENEYNLIADLKTSVRFYKSMIEKFCK